MSQDPTQEDYKHVVAQAKADCIAAGLSLSGPCGAIRISNLTAWRLGYKLLGKGGGNRACLRADMSCVTEGEPGFADGYLVHLPSGYGVDILGDAGGDNDPAWQPETDPRLVARNLESWKEPLFDPAVMSGTPPDPPDPPDTGDLEQRVTDLEAAVMVLSGKHDALAVDVENNRLRMEAINDRMNAIDAASVKHPLPDYSGRAPMFGGTVISKPVAR